MKLNRPSPKFLFHAVRDLVEVVAHGFGVERGADRMHVLQQARRCLEGDQGGPFRLKAGHLRRDTRAEQFRQRTEGSGSCGAAPAALQARAFNLNVSEWRAEREGGTLLAPETVQAVGAGPAVLHEGGGLRRHDPFLEPAEKLPGLVERKPDPLKRVVRLVESEHLLVNDVAFAGIDP